MCVCVCVFVERLEVCQILWCWLIYEDDSVVVVVECDCGLYLKCMIDAFVCRWNDWFEFDARANEVVLKKWLSVVYSVKL